MPATDSESCLGNVLYPDLYLVVTRTQIYFGKNLGTLQLVKKIINSEEGYLFLILTLFNPL